MKRYRILNTEKKLTLNYVSLKEFCIYGAGCHSRMDSKFLSIMKKIIYKMFIFFVVFPVKPKAKKKDSMATNSIVKNYVVIKGVGNTGYIKEKMDEAITLHDNGSYLKSMEILNELNFNWCEDSHFFEKFKQEFHVLMSKNISSLQGSVSRVA